MLNLDKIFSSVDALINESNKNNMCMLNGSDITFTDIRNAVKEAKKDVFSITPVNKQYNAYITFKDGNFIISPDKPDISAGFQLKDADAKMWKAPKCQCQYMNRTLKDIYDAVSELDGNLFENGKNYLRCVMAAPLEGREKEYGDKFLVIFPEVAQFDAGMNRMDGLPAAADEILSTVGNCPCVANIGRDQINALKKAEACKKQLESLEKQLETMADGLGWRCTLDQYVNDKYSRFIINTAMKYGIDISRDSQFVKSLIGRLAKITPSARPTKSDLITYAKCDKIDFRTDAYRNFLSDIEQNTNYNNDKILSAVVNFQKKLIKIINGLTAAVAAFDESGCKDISKIQTLTEQDQLRKKDITGIIKYFQRGPIVKLVGCNDKIYVMTADFSGITAITDLFEN